MTTEYVWADEHDRLVRSWADAPGAELEQRILDAFMEHPQLVIETAKSVSEGFTSGTIRSPWPVLAQRVERAIAVSERSSAPVRGEKDRKKALTRGRQWMRAAGMHFDRADEVEDELFGPHGMLRAHADDPELHDDLLQLWHDLRPTGEQIEQEAEQRGRAYIAGRQQAAKALAPKPPPEPAIAMTGNPFLVGE